MCLRDKQLEKRHRQPNTYRLRLPGQGPTFLPIFTQFRGPLVAGQGPTFLPMFKPFRGPLVTQTRIVPGFRLGFDVPMVRNELYSNGFALTWSPVALNAPLDAQVYMHMYT